MLTRRNARKICNTLIEEQYPGFVLLMDKLGDKAYLSLWGQGRERIEIAFSRNITGTVVRANVARYKIS